jgi:hypothetical protein
VRELRPDARRLLPWSGSPSSAGPGSVIGRAAPLRPSRRCAPRRIRISHVRCYPAVDASRVHPSTPATDADPGGRSFLDFAVVADRDGPHSVAVTYDHAGDTPLVLGLALDRAQARTVRYPPLLPGATRRTTTVDMDMRRGPGVIRVAEGVHGGRLRVHSLRVTGICAAREAADTVSAPALPAPPGDDA